VSSSLEILHPLFGGIGDLVAGDGRIRVAWSEASDDRTPASGIVYRLYLASGPGDQDFAAPPTRTTAAGETTLEIDGLPNGVTVFAVVRAVDTDGREDPNTVEWVATPNPVRYVRAGSAGGDGLAPATAFPSLGSAVGASLGLGGVNFWIAEGLYAENIFLLPGMSAYGGFASDFDLPARDPPLRDTQFATLFSATPLATLAPVSGVPSPAAPLIAIDGLSLAGNGVSPAGVFVEDAFFRISRCRVFDMAGKGIELRSHVPDSLSVEGTVRGCIIEDTGGEGIVIAAIPDVSIDDNLVRRTGTEGIESQWVHASAALDARIEVTRNLIEECGDEGIDLDFAEADPADPSASQGARIRAFVRNNRVERCRLQGILLDLDFQNSDGIDFRARVEDNEVRANGLDGILIDGDARGTFRVARNVLAANAGAGIAITGTAAGPWARLLHNRILGNGAGIAASGAVTVEVRHQIIRGNRGPAVSSDRAAVDVVASILAENAAPSSPDAIRNSLVHGEPIPGAAGEGMLAGDPGLENHPLFLDFAAADAPAGEIPLADTARWQVGDAAEIRDDGVLRTVTAVEPGALAVSPGAPIAAGDLVAAWRGATDAIEREGFIVSSPAIDGGDPLDEDRDGTRADLGPIGGDTPGNVGIETAIALEGAALEIIAMDPPPCELQTGETWSLRFNRELPPAVVSLLGISSGGVDLTADAAVSIRGTSMEIDLPSGGLSPGVPVLIELLPGDAATEGKRDASPRPELPDPVFTPAPGLGSTPELDFGTVLLPGDLIDPTAGGAAIRLREHIALVQGVGSLVLDADSGGADSNGTVATAQPLPAAPLRIDAAIDAAGDADCYRLELAAGETVRIEAMAGQLESPLVARIELLSADGATLIASAEALPPFFFDPVLPPFTAPSAIAVLIRVAGADPLAGPTGPYRVLAR